MQLRQPDLRARTKALSIRVLRLYRELIATSEGRLLAKRLLRYVTRAGAYYRAALRCRTLRSYIKRLDNALYDLELAAYWIELMSDGAVTPRLNLEGLLTDVQEVMAILVACRRKAKKAGHRQTMISSN